LHWWTPSSFVLYSHSADVKLKELRRRRAECSVELRKQKRENEMMKRRNVDLSEQFESEGSSNEQKLESLSKDGTPKLTVSEAVVILQNNPSVEQMRCCFEAIRRLLSRSKTPPIDEVIKSGLVTALVQALSVSDEKVQFEAAWGITNIVSGTTEQTVAVVNEGALPPLVQLCYSKNKALAEQALWAMANVIGDSAQLRDQAVECGVLEALDYVVGKVEELSEEFARTIAWTYSNICRHKKPSLSIAVLRRLAPAIVKLLSHKASDNPVRQDACWALSYLTDGSDEQIKVAGDANCMPALMPLVQSGNDAEVAPAIRVFGNFATGSDDLTQMVVDAGVLECIDHVIRSAKSLSIEKECCWLLSNVIAGTHAQIQAVLDARLLPTIFTALRDGDFRSKFEASWAVSNLAHGGSSAQVMELSNDEYITVLCNLLDVPNADFICNLLDTLFIVLKTAQNLYPDRLKQIEDSVEGDFRSKFEASWAVSNLAHGGSSAQVMELSNDEYITVLCNLLDVPNADFICNLLDTLFIVLKTAQNLYPDRLKQIEDSVESSGGLDRLEMLQENENTRVYEWSYKIIEQFFTDEADEQIDDEIPDDQPINF
uniref:IBB domain-containing protein n=1 Tax=Ascaris lumbricoides TaxID=6252 RepID=A0A0M3HSC2_ASCLU